MGVFQRQYLKYDTHYKYFSQFLLKFSPLDSFLSHMESRFLSKLLLAPARTRSSDTVSRASRRTAWLLLTAPTAVYALSLWLVWPVPLSLATPALLLITPLVIAVSRRDLISRLSMLRIEFSLLGVMTVLSLLSMINSNDPVRTIRIIYPCLVPLAIFGSFVALGPHLKNRLLFLPRLLVAACLLLSIAPFILSFALPPLQEHLFRGFYRLNGFFENPIQHAIALAVVLPLVTAELAMTNQKLKKIAWAVLWLLLVYTLFRTGSKTPLAVGLIISTALYATLRIRRQHLLRTGLLLCALGAAACLLAMFGLELAERLDPTVGRKMRSIVEGGISNYQSLKSRRLLWNEAMNEGKAHWLIGSGAGEKVLGLSHAHNLVLDYFKGIGIIGALSVACLCLVILLRTAAKWLHVIRCPVTSNEQRILACYVASMIYILCNQLSDCFGPSTIGFLWIVYLSGVLSEDRASRLHATIPTPARANNQVSAKKLGPARRAPIDEVSEAAPPRTSPH